MWMFFTFIMSPTTTPLLQEKKYSILNWGSGGPLTRIIFSLFSVSYLNHTLWGVERTMYHHYAPRVPGGVSRAEERRRYIQRLKQDPDRYRHFLEKNRQYCKKYYSKFKTRH